MSKKKVDGISSVFDFSLKEVDQIRRDAVSDYIEEAIEPLEEYINMSTGKGDMIQWIERNKKLYGNPFSYTDSSAKVNFSDEDKKHVSDQIKEGQNGNLFLKYAKRPYLIPYINDRAADKSVIKGRQSELSENEINENIFMSATIPHCKVRHIFPTTGMGLTMAKEKVGPGVLNSPKIKRLLKKPYSLTSKEFMSGGFYTIDGSWTDHGGRGPSSDKITFDEYETQNPMIEEIYSQSLSHSSIGRITRISTPILPGSGIDLMYEKGCRYEWFTKCPKCKKEQMLSFPDNIMNFFETNHDDLEEPSYLKKLEKIYIGCKYCGTYIDRNSGFYLDNSRFIPQKKHLVFSRSSYRMSQMMLPWITGKQIISDYHKFMFVHQFWNEVMGFAYVDPSAVIDRELFLRVVDNAFKNDFQGIGNARNVSVGIDWGKDESWVVVRASGFAPNEKHSKVIYVEKICPETLKANGYEGNQNEHVERASDIIETFRAKIVVNDANGIGSDRNETLIKRYPQKAWGCFYDTDEIQKQKTKQKLIIPQWSSARRTVNVSRLYTFRSLIREFEERRVTIPQLSPMVELFVKHHCALAIQKMVDDKGRVYEIVGHTGPDHLGHANNYSKIGFEKIVNNQREGFSAGIVTKKSRKKSERQKRKEELKAISGNPDLD
jgi:hypothetical protein